MHFLFCRFVEDNRRLPAEKASAFSFICFKNCANDRKNLMKQQKIFFILLKTNDII